MTHAPWVLAAGILLVSAPAAAAPFPDPDLAHFPVLRSRVTSERTGKVLQTSRVSAERSERDGARWITVRSVASLPSGAELQSTTVLRAQNTVHAVEIERRVRAADGSTLSFDMRQVRADALPYSGLSVPEDTYPISDVLLYLLGYLPLDTHGRGSFYVLGEMQAFKLDVWKAGTGKVRVPAGVFDCNRMRLRPNAESLHLSALLRPLARLVLPEFEVWTAREAPHVVVRIQGPMGPPADRDVVLELLAIEPQGQ